MGSLSGTAVGEYVRTECGPIVGYGETLDPADSKLWFEVEGQRFGVPIGTDAESIRARFSLTRSCPTAMATSTNIDEVGGYSSGSGALRAKGRMDPLREGSASLVGWSRDGC